MLTDTKRKKLTRRDLAGAVARVGGLTEAEAYGQINLVLDTLAAHLAAGHDVELRGLGSFRWRVHAGNHGLDIKTRARLAIGPSRRLAFRGGKGLRSLPIVDLLSSDA